MHLSRGHEVLSMSKKFSGEEGQNIHEHIRKFKNSWYGKREYKKANFLSSLSGAAEKYLDVATDEDLRSFDNIVKKGNKK